MLRRGTALYSVRRLTDLLVFVGPSGCGKSTLINQLRGEFPDIFSFSTSHTTRAPRKGEVNGKDYHFVTKSEFEALLAQDAFIEYTELQTASSSTEGEEVDDTTSTNATSNESKTASTVNYYGTSKAALRDVLRSNRVVLMDTDVLGAINIRRYCDGNLTPVAPPHPPSDSKVSDGQQHHHHHQQQSSATAVCELPGWDPAGIKLEQLAHIAAAAAANKDNNTEEHKKDGSSTGGSSSGSGSDHGPVRALRCEVFFVAPPSMAELEERLRARASETPASLQRRLGLGRQWMAWADTNESFFDHRLVNDKLDVCYQEVRGIVLSEVVSIQKQQQQQQSSL